MKIIFGSALICSALVSSTALASNRHHSDSAYFTPSSWSPAKTTMLSNAIRGQATFKGLAMCAASGATICRPDGVRTSSGGAQGGSVVFEGFATSFDGLVDSHSAEDFSTNVPMGTSSHDSIYQYAARALSLDAAMTRCENAAYDVCSYVGVEDLLEGEAHYGYSHAYESRVTVRGYMLTGD